MSPRDALRHPQGRKTPVLRTPGPWKFVEFGGSFGPTEWPVMEARDSAADLLTGKALAIAAVGLQADARLIAAAPDLLEALKNLVGQSEQYAHLKPEIADARAAIAKATVAL